MQETWYVLENGTAADPNDVAPTGDGRLMHKSGVLVAMRGQVPASRGVDPEAERAKAAAPKSRDMKADGPRRGYTTREAKAD
ncbi:MAG: hypothetical protein AB7F35_06430 [Acetobacteraceae bacterium]